AADDSALGRRAGRLAGRGQCRRRPRPGGAGLGRGLARRSVRRPRGAGPGWIGRAAPDLDDGEPRRALGLGRLPRGGPRGRPERGLAPWAETSGESYRYEFVAATSGRGTYSRYPVGAVPADGLLARAFSTPVRTAD